MKTNRRSRALKRAIDRYRNSKSIVQYVIRGDIKSCQPRGGQFDIEISGNLDSENVFVFEIEKYSYSIPEYLKRYI